MLSIALKDQDEITTWLRKGDELAINPLDPTILAARAVGMLLQSDYQGAAAFFSQLIKNKKNISADYYDLYFPLINKWLTDNIDRFMEAEIHADEEYVSMAMYALGKMFIEGSEKWKNQSKEGWLYQKNENDEFPQQVTAFDLINKAKDMGYPPAMYYLVTQESMLPDEVRMRYIKSIFDQEKDVFTQEEINTIRSMLTTKVEKDNNIPAGVLLAYDAYKKGKLSGWLKKHDSYATTLFQDIKTLSQAMHYCSQHCFQELSKKAAAIIGIDLFERIQQELETIAQETQINLPHIRKHLAIADVQVERQTSDETEIKLKILYDTKGSNFDRFISIPRKKKTQGNLPPLVVEDPPLDDFFQKIHAHNQQCNQQGRVAWALFDLAEKSFQKQEYEASVEFIDKAITSLCFLQHLMVSQDQNKQIKFNGMLVTLGQQKNKSIQDTIGRIQRKQEEYTKSISAEEITKARNYYQKIALLHTQFMKIKKNRSKKNIAFKKLKEELEEIPAIKAMLSAQEENDDERMREIKNRNLDQKILNYLGREFLASHYRIDQLCGLDFSQRVPATKVPTTTEAVEMSEVIPLPKDSVENSRSLDNNNKDSEPKKGYPKIIIQSYKDPHDLCDALKMIASIEDQLETGDNS